MWYLGKGSCKRLVSTVSHSSYEAATGAANEARSKLEFGGNLPSNPCFESSRWFSGASLNFFRRSSTDMNVTPAAGTYHRTLGTEPLKSPRICSSFHMVWKACNQPLYLCGDVSTLLDIENKLSGALGDTQSHGCNGHKAHKLGSTVLLVLGLEGESSPHPMECTGTRWSLLQRVLFKSVLAFLLH